MSARDEILSASSDDLATAAEQLSKIAVELLATSKVLDVDSEALRQTAIGTQAESMRAAMVALTVRGVAERLVTVARSEQSTEASHAE
jgi:hypothetical protein